MRVRRRRTKDVSRPGLLQCSTVVPSSLPSDYCGLLDIVEMLEYIRSSDTNYSSWAESSGDGIAAAMESVAICLIHPVIAS